MQHADESHVIKNCCLHIIMSTYFKTEKFQKEFYFLVEIFLILSCISKNYKEEFFLVILTDFDEKSFMQNVK